MLAKEGRLSPLFSRRIGYDPPEQWTQNTSVKDEGIFSIPLSTKLTCSVVCDIVEGWGTLWIEMCPQVAEPFRGG